MTRFSARRLLLGLGIAGSLVVVVPPAAPAAAGPPPLRDLADARGLLFGSASEYPALTTNPGGSYRRMLARHFNALTPGNEMKWDSIHPEPDVFDFTKADALVAFAQRNDMQVRGHTLVWHSQNPPWLSSFTGTRDDWIALLQHHITTVVDHYRGDVVQWDVVNEPFDAGGGLRSTVWFQHIGPDYIRLAFEAAHAADPDALLYLNEFGAEGVGPKSDAVYSLVADLVADGVPIDGVGLQAHYAAVPCASCGANMATNMARLGALGVDVAITELDVRIALPSSTAERQTQADLYGAFLNACLGAPTCHTFVVWGFTDLDSWIPEHFPGFGEATLFDVEYHSKPATKAVRSAMQA